MPELRNVADLKDMLTKDLDIQAWGPVFDQIDALLDRIRAEALRDAARHWDLPVDGMPRTGSRAGDWLRNRADQTEQENTDA